MVPALIVLAVLLVVHIIVSALAVRRVRREVAALSAESQLRETARARERAEDQTAREQLVRRLAAHEQRRTVSDRAAALREAAASAVSMAEQLALAGRKAGVRWGPAEKRDAAQTAAEKIALASLGESPTAADRTALHLLIEAAVGQKRGL